ncbi:MAG: PRTRC system protein E, partial [Psychrobacter sp.]|nr:PRTRC system protein E [Psychrobacter sp.]
MYLKIADAHKNHNITYDDGTIKNRYCRYEIGKIEGKHRDIFALIADQNGFDGLGFDPAPGSDDDNWHIINLFKDGGIYIDTVAINGAMDSDHALKLADNQFDFIGADYGVIVSVTDDAMFDSLNGQGETWSVDTVQKLLSNPSQDKHYLPVITPKELAEEAHRVTFDSVQWDGYSLLSHQGSDRQLHYDLVKADTLSELVGDFNLSDELQHIGAEIAEFDALMDTNSRLPLLKDRLFKALSRASTTDLQVTNVTQTEPFKRQGTTNVAFTFDLSDGQKLSIWFHNPDSTPNKVLPSDIMISWKWMLNKRDVTAALSPKNGDNVQLPTLAARIMRVAKANSARFQRAQARRQKTDAEIKELETEADQKRQLSAQLDTEIEALKGRIADAKNQKA